MGRIVYWSLKYFEPCIPLLVSPLGPPIKKKPDPRTQIAKKFTLFRKRRNSISVIWYRVFTPNINVHWRENQFVRLGCGQNLMGCGDPVNDAIPAFVIGPN